MNLILDRLKSSVSSFLRTGVYSRSRKEELRRDGYTVFRGLVPTSVVQSVRSAIDSDIASNYDESKLTEYQHQSYCPSLREDPAVMRLIELKPVREMLESYLGHGTYEYGTAQIAIRKAHNVPHEQPPVPHIDGVKTDYNGVTSDELDTFTALVGVFLTKADCDFSGNFTVWPGSHLILEEYFRQRGPKAMYEGIPDVEFGEPLQIKFSPGDVVLSHYQLAHAAAVNVTDNDRIAIYFRVSLNQQKEKGWLRLTNIWDGWLLD